MRSIIKYFIEHPTIVNLCLFLLVGIGIFQIANTRTTTFPAQRVRFIDVTVPYPGATPEEVEEGVTLKIEEELWEVDGIDRVTSQSQNNLAVVNIEMTEEAETNIVMAEVKNAIDKINNFPRGVEPPIVEKRDVPNLALAFAVTSKSKGQSANDGYQSSKVREGTGPKVALQVKKDYADRIERELLAIDGISDIIVTGTPAQEIEITVREEALRNYGLSFQRIAAAVSSANLNTFGGEIKTGKNNITLKADSKGYYAKNLENIVVAAGPNGGTVRLGDLATITDRFKDAPGDRYLGEDQVVTITVNALQSEDVIANADATRAYLEAFNADNEIIQLEVIEDGTVQVTDRLKSMTSSGITGIILVLLVLALFLNRYLAFWVALKIPIAIIASFILKDIQGLTLNVVSLFGFILVLGILVDDGVVIGENIYRWAKEKGVSPAKAALEGTMEVVTPILISISTTAVAFSLFFFLPTQAGEFFGEMGFVVIAVLFMAVIESFFFLPAHLAHSKALSGDTKLTKVERWFNNIVEWLGNKIYRPAVDRISANGWLASATIAVFAVFLVASLSLVGSGVVGFTFFPNLDDDAHTIQLEMRAGTPKEVTLDKLRAIQQAAYKANENMRRELGVDYDLIRYVEITTGPAENQGNLKVTYRSGEERDVSSFEISEAIRAEAPSIPEAESIVYGLGASTAIFGKPVAFSLNGDDLVTLRAARDELKSAMENHPDLKDISDNDRVGVQEAILRLKPQAYSLGLDLATVMNQVRSAYFGIEAQSLQRGDDEVEIWLRYPRDERNSESQLLEMRISGPNGGNYPLGEVATIDYGTSVLSINHISGRRAITVDANVAAKDVSAPTVIQEIESGTLAAFASRYPGVSYSVEGQNRQSFKMSAAIAGVGPVVFLFIFALIVLNFNSFSQAFLVFGMYPFALIGVVLGHWVHGEALNIFSVVGTIALIGVFTNNGLVFISQFNQELEEGNGFLDSLKEAARTRFRPILLTTVTTVAGLAPLITSSSLGAQFLKGPALAIAYGMGVGLFAILLMLPAYLLLANRLRRVNFRLFHRGKPIPAAAQLEPTVKNLANKITAYLLPIMMAGGMLTADRLTAQTPTPVLTLDEAIITALAENDDLKALAYEREISRNNVNPALTGKRPTVAFNGSIYYGYADGRAQTAGLGGPDGGNNPPIELAGVKHGVQFGPEANWLIFDGGRGNNRLATLRLLDENVALQLEGQREATVARVMNSYLRVAQLREQLQLDTANIALTKERLNRILRDQQYGSSTTLRRLQAEVDLRSDSITYENSLLELNNARRSLNNLMSRDPETDFELPEIFPPANHSLTFDSLSNELLTANEELTLAQKRIELDASEIKATDLSNAISIQAYARANYLNTTDNSNFLQENRSFGPEIGFRVSKTIYDGGRLKIEKQNARIRLEQSRQELTAVRNQLLTKLRQELAGYDKDRRQLATERRNLELFELNYEKTLTDFQLGQVDGTAARTAQNNLNAARTRISLLEFGLHQRLVELRRLTGGLVR